MKKYLFILSVILLVVAGCSKDDPQPTPDKDKFALPVWKWSKGISIDAIDPLIPAIDNADNSYYFIHFNNSQNPTLLALNNKGEMRWQIEDAFDKSAVRSSSVILSGGNLYFYSGRTVYCYQAQDGSKIWSHEVAAPGVSIQNLLVINNEVWFTHTESGIIVLVKLDTSGNKLWETSYDAYSFNMGMAAYKDKIYLLNKALFKDYCDVMAVSLNDGSEIWKASPEATSSAQDISIDSNGDLYFSTDDGELIALNGSDGTERWRFKPKGSTGNRYSEHNGIIITSDNDVIFASGDLIRFDNKGFEKWRSTVNSNLSFALGNNGILYGWGAALDVKLFAVDAETGEKLSIKFSTLDDDLQATSNPAAMMHDGNLIMVGLKNIHCLTSMSTSLADNCWAKQGRSYNNNPVR